MRGDIQTLRDEMQHGLAALSRKVDAQSTTLVSMRRELRSLQSDVAVALSALDDHSRRLSIIEKPDDDRPPRLAEISQIPMRSTASSVMPAPVRT